LFRGDAPAHNTEEIAVSSSAVIQEMIIVIVITVVLV
jgi:hypothetical protein